MEFDPAALYAMFIFMPVIFQTLILKGYEQKKIEEASYDLITDIRDASGNPVYIHEFMDQEHQRVQKRLLESFIGSRIQEGIKMQVHRDLLKLHDEITITSADKIVEQPILHQNMATNTYGSSLMVPYDINLRLASIVAGEKTMVKVLAMSPGMGMLSEYQYLQDRPASGYADMFKQLYTGLYNQYSSNEDTETVSALLELTLSIMEQYTQQTHQTASIWDIFKGRRLNVHNPPAKLVWDIASLKSIQLTVISWLFNQRLAHLGYVY